MMADFWIGTLSGAFVALCACIGMGLIPLRRSVRSDGPTIDLEGMRRDAEEELESVKADLARAQARLAAFDNLAALVVRDFGEQIDKDWPVKYNVYYVMLREMAKRGKAE